MIVQAAVMDMLIRSLYTAECGQLYLELIFKSQYKNHMVVIDNYDFTSYRNRTGHCILLIVISST